VISVSEINRTGRTAEDAARITLEYEEQALREGRRPTLREIEREIDEFIRDGFSPDIERALKRVRAW